MNDPYATLAQHYDIMVDWAARLARERPFFARLLREHGIRSVLDVGCGAGHHARMFADLGASALGLDPSEPMIARARALTLGDHPCFVLGGFAEIPALRRHRRARQHAGACRRCPRIGAGIAAHARDAQSRRPALHPGDQLR